MQTQLKDYEPNPVTNNDIWQALGLPSRGPKLYQAIHDGLPYAVYDRIASVLMLDKKTLGLHANIAPATLARRSKAGKFSAEESDRLYAFAEVFHAAQVLFEGDIDATRKWMVTPVRGLGGKAPVSMLATRVETQAVLSLIGRLEHGVVV
ncbi:type II RES/Xre toxin-antitoxin system antitoxin [Pseudomonas serbica]|uniref:type II RES/Xre toxin-antitoxin system antitoxin n=1 Tax=Pseudomonas serbica TaxID=2965074 RepID=UPI00237ACFD9|nr:antitoxin Xre/MbcA/ParS toxin-binding domain-containing protein [Pseudomonas serbica]